MSISKIIFLNYIPLTEKGETDFHLKYYRQHGIEVEYWELQFIFPSETILQSSFKSDYVRQFSSIAAFKSAMQLEASNYQSQLLVVPQMTREWRIAPILLELTKLGCKTTLFDVSALPRGTSSKHVRRKLLALLSPKKLTTAIKNRIQNKLFAGYYRRNLIKEYDFVFAAGESAASRWGKQTKVVPINSVDFDMAISLPQEKLINEPYALFLDEYLPFHPDFALFGMETVEPDRYFDCLRRFFVDFEKLHKIPVVIAVHPKSSYEGTNYFENRPMYKGATAQLVRDAKVVLCHASTSVGYAAIFKIPVLFLSYAEMARKTPHLEQLMNMLSYELGAQTHDLEMSYSPIKLEAHSEKDEAYVKKYLSVLGLNAKRTRDIVLDYLRT